MDLVTEMTAEEIQELQEAMRSPSNVERLHKKFPDAIQPDEYLTPEALRSAYSLAPGEDIPVTKRMLSTREDGPFGAGRYEKAKACQPPAGKRPYPASPHIGTILRLGDGRLVFRTSYPDRYDFRYLDLSVNADE